MPNKRNHLKDSTSVITVRINDDLNKIIEKTCKKLGITKASLIRSYLEMSKYLIKQKNSLKSLNDRDFIIVKRNYLRKLIEKSEEEEQIRLGDKIARFINDLARIDGKLKDIDYKLDMCDNFGFFPKFIDTENYILISKKFGPRKFVEAFIWRCVNYVRFFFLNYIYSVFVVMNV